MNNTIIKERLIFLLKEGKIESLENFVALGIISKEDVSEIFKAAKEIYK